MHFAFPLLTPEVSARIEASETAYWAERVEALRAIPGNPYGAQVRHFGQTIALLTSGANNDELFNRVSNFGRATLSHLDEILAWYKTHNTSCRFDIIPTVAEPDIFHQLARRSFNQSSFSTVLYGLPKTNCLPPAHITIRTALPEERDTLTAIYSAGFALAETSPALTYKQESLRLLPGRPSIRTFFALIDASLAGMALLFLHNRTAFLATATTLPAFRGQGCHQALIHARVLAAASTGCDLIVSETRNPITQHNMESLGLRIAHTKAIWTRYG